MKTSLHHAFGRRVRDRAMGLLIAAVALVPAGMPKDLASWFAEQFPAIPGWSHWVLAVGIAAWRIYAASQAVKDVP